MALYYRIFKMSMNFIDYKYLWNSYLSFKEEQARDIYFTRNNTVLFYFSLFLVCNIYQSQVISKSRKKAIRNK